MIAVSELGDSSEEPVTTALLERVRRDESPAASDCLELSAAFLQAGETEEAFRWLVRVADMANGYVDWHTAARELRRIPKAERPSPKRHVRLAVLGSYTTSQLVDLVELVSASRGMDVDIYQAGYQQYSQEILNGDSGLWEFDPQFILIAVHESDLQLPGFSSDPNRDVDIEVSRWASLWDAVQARTDAKVIMTNFVSRPEDPFGHLSSRLFGSRRTMISEVNRRLGARASDSVSIVDCQYLASQVGLEAWFDDRYWHVSKQAVGFEALPTLATHIVAVLAAEIGLSRKCLVLDLDGTLWGGVVGEVGWENVRLGYGPDGEAYVAFQEYLKALKDRGVVLAVCSKNDESTAKEVFKRHPEMRLDIEDISMFVANWDPKPDNTRFIATSLDLGLDSLVFVDDHPGERAAIRWALPEVDVLPMPDDPGDYVRTLGRYPFFAMSSFTEEDSQRTEQYRARAGASTLKSESSSLDEFLSKLNMSAVVGEFDDFSLNRVTQLVNKTNQFNLTGRRHPRGHLETIRANPDYSAFHVRLRDDFGDHGIVSVVIGQRIGSSLEVDTFVMSCRVIGRTLEAVVVAELIERARSMGCDAVIGTYRPSPKNSLVADLYDRLGFEQLESDDESTRWRIDVEEPVHHPYIEIES